ncbi:MAG: two-component system NtrC family nitrogen regulation sensor histidine kinase [Geobacteraceae bacterium]|nr:MAG: two-component system NtrC family nitrogen regulation sensor histidine kinase [Geobacteraceae bacterium]
MRSYTFTVDDRLRISSWNKDLGTLSGKDYLDVCGMIYYEVIPKIRKGDADAILRVLEDGKPAMINGYNFECVYEEVRADVVIDPITDDAGIVKGAGVTIINLQSCVLEKKLQQLQPIIDIGNIAPMLAHGVRNPLNAIKGAVVYIKDKYADEKTLVEFTGIMEEEISRLDNFVTKFLCTSFFDAEISETDVNAMIKRLELFTSFQARTCNINVICKYGDVPPIMLSSFQVEQALLNIINNAIEAMPSEGRLFVETSVEKRSEQDYIVIQISDTGPGMVNSGENYVNILSNVRIKGEGKGFGLFITREVIQYHGGHMEIQSEKGIGTTIKIFLPANKL